MTNTSGDPNELDQSDYTASERHALRERATSFSVRSSYRVTEATIGGEAANVVTEVSRQTLLGDAFNEQYVSDVLDETRRRLDSLHERSRLARYDALLDPFTLFVLNRIVEANGLHVTDLDEVLANGRGWARIIRLVQAGVLELAGEFVEVTDLGRQAFAEVIKFRQTNDG
jgi:hypothetical protein